jgi:hypothetical protein
MKFSDQNKGVSVRAKTGERKAATPCLLALDTIAAKLLADDMATFRASVLTLKFATS